MKKLLLNIVFGVIVAVVAMSLSTSIVGIILVNEGQIEWMVEELFTNVETKVLMASVGGFAIGVSSYLNRKYEETNKVLSFVCSMIGIIIVIFLINLTSYTIVFKVTYLSVLALIICILEFARYISDKKDINAINQKLQENKREEK